jgi:hypothetical protein
VIVDGRSMTLSPAEDNQVKFTISLIYQVSGVPNRKKCWMRKLILLCVMVTCLLQCNISTYKYLLLFLVHAKKNPTHMWMT